MSDKLIKAENIYKSYRTVKEVHLEVLKGISMEIEAKKISVIVGASGAGKSTLLHLLGGLDKPDKGNIFFDGENISSLSDDRLARFRNNKIGFVFQFHHLLPEFTAVENVTIPQLISGINYKEAEKHSKEILSEVGLTERIEHKPAELSGGEQQRVALARSLANNPDIILADEPTGNLDSVNSDSIHKLIFDLKDNLGKTFLIVTHNPGLVELADNLYEIKDGFINKK